MENNIFRKLEIFREDRGLDKNQFDMETYLRKDFEEMFELMGFEDDRCKAIAKEKAAKMFSLWKKAKEKGMCPKYSPFNKIDALGDRVVYAIEGIEQHGYNAEIVMDEIQKEINSRNGEIIDGKFEKFKTDEAKAKWYKANFHNALRI